MMRIDWGTKAGHGGQLGGHCNSAGERWRWYRPRSEPWWWWAVIRSGYIDTTRADPLDLLMDWVWGVTERVEKGSKVWLEQQEGWRCPGLRRGRHGRNRFRVWTCHAKLRWLVDVSFPKCTRSYSVGNAPGVTDRLPTAGWPSPDGP